MDHWRVIVQFMNEHSHCSTDECIEVKDEYEAERLLSQWSTFENMFIEMVEEEIYGIPKQNLRRCAKGVAHFTNEVGRRCVTMSLWYGLDVAHPNVDSSSFHNLFRRRIRVPCTSYLDLVEQLRGSDRLERWKAG
jgi:PTB domain (IRS-1 type)